MWLKKLKRKKMQFFLLGIMLFAIATVFCTCISFTLELKTYAKNRFSEENCPDIYVYSLNNAEPRDNFPEDSVWKNIKQISVLKGKCISVPMRHNDVNISSITNMMCTLKDDSVRNYMDITEGDKKSKEPGNGDTWIAKTLASSYDINIGDKLIVTYDEPVELTVTAIYTATFAPSERLTIMANIVNSQTLEAFKHETDAGVLGLDLYDTGMNSINKLAMGNPYALLTFDRAGLCDYITKISGVVGSVAAVAALVVFLAALFIIGFIINNNIRKELRSIGIYKSMGLSSDKIIGFYIKAYMLIGWIAIILGAAASLPLVYYLGASTSDTLGGFRISATSVWVCAGAVIILIVLLWSGSMLALKQVKNITPVEAVTAGQALGEHKLARSVIKNAKSPFTMAINDIVKHRKTSIVTFLVLMVSVYLILFFTSSYYTCVNIYKNVNVWVACPKFNAIVTGSVDETVAQFIRDSGYAQSAICGNVFYYPPVTIPQYTGNARAIEFVVLDDTSEEITGITMKEGYSPRRHDELAVSRKLLKKLNMKIGQYLTIEIGDRTKDFLIYGTFDSMEELSIIMNAEGMSRINESYVPGNCFVRLKEDTDFKVFQNYVESKFSSVAVDQEWTALKYAVLAIEKMLTGVMRVMLIVFIVFVIISVINVLTLTIRSKRRQYGILKSLGFTTGYMIVQNLVQILILFGIATVLAIIVHLILSKYLFALLVIDAMIHSGVLTGMLLLGTAILIIIVTLLLSLPIKRITPVDLMEE